MGVVHGALLFLILSATTSCMTPGEKLVNRVIEDLMAEKYDEELPVASTSRETLVNQAMEDENARKYEDMLNNIKKVSIFLVYQFLGMLETGPKLEKVALRCPAPHHKSTNLVRHPGTRVVPICPPNFRLFGSKYDVLKERNIGWS